MYYYLYCVTRSSFKSHQCLTGIDDYPLNIFYHDEIAAVLSEANAFKIPVTPENALRHNAVVEGVHREQTVLPMRFSSVFDNKDKLQEFLKSRYSVFVSDLNRLHNKLEMGLRIISNNNTILRNKISWEKRRNAFPQASGSKYKVFHSSNHALEYLEQRRSYFDFIDEQNNWIQEITNTCHAQFEGLYIECRKDEHNSALEGISLSYLIHNDCLTEFKNRFYDLKTSLEEFHFLCSGPWPPYHFVS